MKIVFAALLILLLASCDIDVNHSSYANLSEANGKTWLPDVLPPSTINIRETTNVDLNDANGEFHFSPNEAPQLFSKLTPNTPTHEHFVGWKDTVNDYLKEGRTAWSFRDEYSEWAFFCTAKTGQCDFYMWPRHKV